MSFYGNIKRINSSPFVFDRIYPSRAAMDEAMAITDTQDIRKDNIYIGRYVLIKYTTKYASETNETTGEEDEARLTLEEFNKYINKTYTPIELTAQTYRPNIYYVNGNNGYTISANDFDANAIYYMLQKQINPLYSANAEADMNKYKDTYDGTVWQKVYTAANEGGEPQEKYILIAELNAAVPRLDLDVVSPKFYSGTGDNAVEEWVYPEVIPEASSEDAYTFQMPNVLHLDVGDMDEDFYARALIADPSTKVLLKKGPLGPDEETTTYDAEEAISHAEMLDPEHNYMRWTNMYYDNNDKLVDAPKTNKQKIDAKKLDTQLYAFGQLISDLYDALYGAPENGNGGPRPFYTGDLEGVLSNYDKGLVGILSSIASDSKGDGSEDLYSRKLQPGMYYYFTTKWNDASEDPDNFIENIPEIIGAKGDGPTLAHYWLDFEHYEQNEVDNTTQKPIISNLIKNTNWS